eukprot:Skav204578  [mRNA]  locus=scaffold767:67180:71039:+ [translate_table: standard]
MEVIRGTRMGIEIGRYTAYLNSQEKYSCDTTESSWMAVSAKTIASRDSANARATSPCDAASVEARIFAIA